ncbi:MAG: mannosyltransferase family protein [Anaerolineae bacterium]
MESIDQQEQKMQLGGFNTPTWLLPPLYAFLSSRVVVFLAAYLADITIKTDTENSFYSLAPENLFLDVFARWDSKFYIDIAENGYELIAGKVSSVAFYPLYPLLISITDILFNNLVFSGVLVSHISFFLALIYLYRLTLLISDEGTAQRTIFYISLFPTAFFFSTIYTESVFLFFSVAAVYYGKKKEWGFASIFTLLTGVTRITGLLVIGIIILEWLKNHGWTIRTILTSKAWKGLWSGIKTDWFNLLLIFLAPLGLLSHMLFLNQHFQDPIAFWSVQSAFNRLNIGPIAIIIRDFGPVFQQNFFLGDIWWNVILDMAAFFGALAAVPFIYKHFGEGFSLYVLLSILLPVSSGTGSMIRYILILFPIFILMGYLGKKQSVDRLIQTAFPVLLGVLTTVFVNWIFVA